MKFFADLLFCVSLSVPAGESVESDVKRESQVCSGFTTFGFDTAPKSNSNQIKLINK